jgi:lipopolysaccharide assembly protein A
MQTLRTILWVLLAVALTAFALFNMVPITVRIWPGYAADTFLPFILLVTFLIGFIPPFLFYRAQGWSLRRTISEQERVINDLRTPVPSMPAASAPAASATLDKAPSVDPLP